MRDVIVSLIIVGLLPTCYRRPFAGLALFSWLAYMRVQDLTWGFARYQRWSYYVAIMMFAGFVVSRERKRWFLPDFRCYIMLLLAVLIGIGCALSIGDKAYQAQRYAEYCKLIAIALMTTSVVDTRERLRAMLWVIALSLGFYGVKSGVGGIVSGGARILRGPGGMLADNNDFALALAMAVPMLFQLGWTERRPEIRRAFFWALPLTVLAVGLTYSRGGFLSVSCAIGVLVWRSRNRVIGIVIAFLLGLSALILAPAEYKERLSTIKDYETEGSAAGRIKAWGIGTRMAMANPWFGVGLNKFRQHYMQFNLTPTPKEVSGEAVIVAHSSYFQIWAECGTPALVLYIVMVMSCLWTCNQVRKLAAKRYFTSWIINYATMFEASTLTFLVGSSFINRAHYDLLYHWVALVVVFNHIARREMEKEDLHPVRYGGRGELHHVASPGFGPRRLQNGFRPGVVPKGA